MAKRLGNRSYASVADDLTALYTEATGEVKVYTAAWCREKVQAIRKRFPERDLPVPNAAKMPKLLEKIVTGVFDEIIVEAKEILQQARD